MLLIDGMKEQPLTEHMIQHLARIFVAGDRSAGRRSQFVKNRRVDKETADLVGLLPDDLLVKIFCELRTQSGKPHITLAHALSAVKITGHDNTRHPALRVANDVLQGLSINRSADAARYQFGRFSKREGEFPIADLDQEPERTHARKR